MTEFYLEAQTHKNVSGEGGKEDNMKNKFGEVCHKTTYASLPVSCAW
jgi:hypothetical protein